MRPDRAVPQAREAGALEGLRLPVALALLTVEAIWLLVAAARLFLPQSGDSGPLARLGFDDRALVAFPAVAGFPAILLPVAAVLVACLAGPPLRQCRAVAAAALVELSASLVLGTVTFLAALLRRDPVLLDDGFVPAGLRSTAESSLVRLGYLLLLGLAIVVVLRAAGFLGRRAPQPAGVPPGGFGRPYGGTPGYAVQATQPGYPGPVGQPVHPDRLRHAGAPPPFPGSGPQPYAESSPPAWRPGAASGPDPVHVQHPPEHAPAPWAEHPPAAWPEQGGVPGTPAQPRPPVTPPAAPPQPGGHSGVPPRTRVHPGVDQQTQILSAEAREAMQHARERARERTPAPESPPPSPTPLPGSPPSGDPWSGSPGPGSPLPGSPPSGSAPPAPPWDHEDWPAEQTIRPGHTAWTAPGEEVEPTTRLEGPVHRPDGPPPRRDSGSSAAPPGPS